MAWQGSGAAPSERESGEPFMAQTLQHSGAGDGDGLPQAIRGDLGAPILGPHNMPLERENPDLLASPSTDAG
jgi:hypothetical protein